jgi:hypothetical protein
MRTLDLDVNRHRKQFYQSVLRALNFGPAMQSFYTVGARASCSSNDAEKEAA